MSVSSPVNYVTIVGNCQAPVLAKKIKACSIPNFEVNSFILHRHSQDQLDEGILGIISSIDKPLSPFGEAMSDFSMNLDNKNIEKRLEIRSKVKSCTLDDLINVSQKYLFNDSKRSVIAGKNYIEEMKSLNFEIKNI